MDLKVAMLTNKPIPYGGIGGVAYNLSKELVQLGVRVDLICRGEKEASERVSENFCTYTIPHYTRDCLKKTIALHSKERFDIVHFMSLGETRMSILVMLTMKALRLPVIMHIHMVQMKRRLSFKNRVTGKIILKLVDKSIFVSKFVKNDVIKRSPIQARKTELVYNGVDTNVFRPIHLSANVKEKFGLENFDEILLSIGILQKRKGQHFIVQGLPHILKHHPNVCYVNVGGARLGVEAEYPKGYPLKLEELVKKLKLAKHVRFLQGLTTDELVQLINLADVCIHPAKLEGFSLAVLEEMACEKPVVGFNVSSTPEAVDHMKNGVLVEPYGNVDNLASTINKLLSDDELAKTLGRQAREKIKEKFTWSRSARQLLTVYRQCVT